MVVERGQVQRQPIVDERVVVVSDSVWEYVVGTTRLLPVQAALR